jgi:hypothetical protein
MFKYLGSLITGKYESSEEMKMTTATGNVIVVYNIFLNIEL